MMLLELLVMHPSLNAQAEALVSLPVSMMRTLPQQPRQVHICTSHCCLYSCGAADKARRFTLCRAMCGSRCGSRPQAEQHVIRSL